MIYLAKLQQRWRQFTKREQTLLALGSLFILIIFLYQFIYKPYDTIKNELSQSVYNQQQLLFLMASAADQIQALKSQSRPRSNAPITSLLATVADSLKNNALTPTQVGQAANEKVMIKFDSIAFDQLIHWLINVWQLYGIEVNQISLIAQQEPGMVEANLQIQLIAT